MAPAKRLKKTSDQHTDFKEAARALECDVSEAAFDRALGKIGKAKMTAKRLKNKS